MHSDDRHTTFPTLTPDAVRTRVIDIVVELAPAASDATVGERNDLVDDLDYHSAALVELGFPIEEVVRRVAEVGVGDLVGFVVADDVEDVRTGVTQG